MDSWLILSRRLFVYLLLDRPPHAPPSLCSYLDRGNIGNAKTAGVQDDLRLNDSQVCERLSS